MHFEPYLDLFPEANPAHFLPGQNFGYDPETLVDGGPLKEVMLIVRHGPFGAGSKISSVVDELNLNSITRPGATNAIFRSDMLLRGPRLDGRATFVPRRLIYIFESTGFRRGFCSPVAVAQLMRNFPLGVRRYLFPIVVIDPVHSHNYYNNYPHGVGVHVPPDAPTELNQRPSWSLFMALKELGAIPVLVEPAHVRAAVSFTLNELLAGRDPMAQAPFGNWLDFDQIQAAK